MQGLTSGRFDLAFLYEHDLDSTIETEPLMPHRNDPTRCSPKSTASPGRRKCRPARPVHLRR